MVFLIIEMGNPYNWFIPYCDNLYFLKFLNVNMLEMHQYLLCPTWNKAKNKEFTVLCIPLNYTIFMIAIKKNSNINNICIFSN